VANEPLGIDLARHGTLVPFVSPAFIRRGKPCEVSCRGRLLAEFEIIVQELSGALSEAIVNRY
jgi:hypothetical protein